MMVLPAIVTDRDSGRRRAPPQSVQGREDMNWLIMSRARLESVSR